MWPPVLLLCGTWDLPGPRLEPMSPALAGGFLTTVPPGKPWKGFLRKKKAPESCVNISCNVSQFALKRLPFDDR